VSATPPWWTAADQAEFELLVFEFVNAAGLHRERCETCSTGETWCDPLRCALDAVIGWRQGRSLRSLAAALRARQDFVDWGVAA
jgi:hypothetical protein